MKARGTYNQSLDLSLELLCQRIALGIADPLLREHIQESAPHFAQKGEPRFLLVPLLHQDQEQEPLVLRRYQIDVFRP